MSTDLKYREPPATRSLRTRIALGLFAAVIIMVLALLIASLSGRNNQDTMHPDSVADDGAGALTAIMSERGTSFSVSHSVADTLTRDGTILVWDPNRVLSQSERDEIIRSGRTVVVVSSDGRDAGAWLSEPSSYTTAPTVEPLSPSCSLPLTDGIDAVEGPSTGVTVEGCFPVGSGYHLVVRDQVRYFASPELFTNEYLDRAHNAAVAIRALGNTDEVVWLMPRPVSQELTSTNTVPPALTGALLGLVVAALWYGLCVRRPVGPLIPEQLPVVVPASETARGRATLYERGRSTEHAGAALRAGTIAQHAGRLGLPDDASPEFVVNQVASASGWDSERVASLLYGRVPRTETDLISLAQDLDTLSKELHHD